MSDSISQLISQLSAYGYPPLSEDAKARSAEVLADIQAIYASGTPLFTKKAIRDVSDQLDAWLKDNDRTFRLVGINGKAVEPAKTLDWPQPEQVEDNVVLQPARPIISYSTIEWLVRRAKRGYEGDYAYLTLDVGFAMESCDATTGKPLYGPYPFPREVLQQGLEGTVKTWHDTDHYRQLHSTLTSLTLPGTLTKIVAFALGSLVANKDLTPASLMQHALVLTLRDLLSPPDKQVECYAQDPAYYDGDKEALKAVGVTVLEDPHGFLEVDDNSLVLSIWPNVPVRQLVTDMSRPLVIIWGTEQEEEDPDPSPRTDPSSSRVFDMLKDEYIAVEFPYHESLRELTLFVRKAKGESVKIS